MIQSLRLAAPLAAVTLAAAPAALAGERLPIVLVSSSGAFDRACPNYYRQGNDADVLAELAEPFCTCMSGNIEAQGLGSEVLDFLARTYSEDLTTFIHEYPSGEAWMQAYFAAEEQCKNTDYGSNTPPEDAGDAFPAEAGSWGGIVRSGPGQQYGKVTSLAEGERITLIAKSDVWSNDYPWFEIRFRGNRRGFQWGGIICSIGDQIDGTFETCP
jgi:hypothetical protein